MKESAHDVTYIPACGENRGSRSNGTPSVELPTGATRSAWVVVCRTLKRYIRLFHTDPVHVLGRQPIHFSGHTPHLTRHVVYWRLSISATHSPGSIVRCTYLAMNEIVFFPLVLSFGGECGRQGQPSIRFRHQSQRARYHRRLVITSSHEAAGCRGWKEDVGSQRVSIVDVDQKSRSRLHRKW